jgi:transcriptional regulator with XRE-family HTH domain
MEAATLLRTARRKARLTQTELAQRLGKSQATVAGLERTGANPTVLSLDEALRALGHRLELRAVPHRSSVDETSIARNLRFSPAERLAAFETAHDEVEELRRLARRVEGDRD